MKTEQQQQALQNAASNVNLTIHLYFQQDKRKTVPYFYATKNGTSVSPRLNYENMQSYLLGWIHSQK